MKSWLNLDEAEFLLVRKPAETMMLGQPVPEGVALPLKNTQLGTIPGPRFASGCAGGGWGAFAQFGLVRELRPASDLGRVTHALVASHVNACNTFYTGLPMETIGKLQRVQNAAAEC